MHHPHIHVPKDAKRAVLLIHGICSTPRHFDWLLPEFDDSWAIYNILLDGHGSSVKAFSESSMKKWKAQTAQMLDMLSEKYTYILLVGYSMGTLLQIHALPKYPKVRGMLLLNVPMRPWVQRKMWARSYRFTKGQIRHNDPHEAACSRDISITLTPGLMQYLRWIPRFLELLGLCRYCRKHAGTITVPCFTYLGKQDELVSLRSQKYLRQHTQLRIFENAGHFYFSPDERSCVRRDLHTLIKRTEP